MKTNNIPLALVGASIAAIVGAAIWAAVTVATNYQIGWMAVGVGFLVGFAVRLLGKGDNIIFGIIGAAFALLGCLIGNLLSIFGFVAGEFDVSIFDIMAQFDYSITFEILKESFEAMDVLFYGLALWQGFKISIYSDDTVESEELPPAPTLEEDPKPLNEQQ